jgi:hypothetical protein
MKQFLVCFFTFILIPTVAKAIAEHRPPNFLINFVVLTPTESVNTLLDERFFAETIERLNSKFRDSSGQQVVSFGLDGVYHRGEVKGSNCSLLDLGIQDEKPARSDVYEAYENCEDERLKSESSLNFYVIESSWETGNRWKNSSAFINWLQRPFVMVNWEI